MNPMDLIPVVLFIGIGFTMVAIYGVYDAVQEHSETGIPVEVTLGHPIGIGLFGGLWTLTFGLGLVIAAMRRIRY